MLRTIKYSQRTFAELERLAASYGKADRSDKDYRTKANRLIYTRLSSELNQRKMVQARRMAKLAKDAGYTPKP